MQASTTPPPAIAASDAPSVDPAALAAALLDWADAAGTLVALKGVATGRYRHVNARMARLVGRPVGEVVGRTDAELFDAAAAASLRDAERLAADAGRPQSSEHRLDLGGERREFTVMRSVLAASGDGEAPLMLCLWTETTVGRRRDAQLKRALEQIEEMQRGEAHAGWRDAVTGLPRSEQFDAQLRREVDLSSREHREFALVSVTIDAPTAAVRVGGAPARARVVEALGRLLGSNTRAMDSACRVDENRFAVLLSGVGLATAHGRMEGLRRQCATQIVMHEGQPIGFTVSMGVASFPHTAHTRQDLLDAADAAMRHAIDRGGNQVMLASIRFESGSSSG